MSKMLFFLATVTLLVCLATHECLCVCVIMRNKCAIKAGSETVQIRIGRYPLSRLHDLLHRSIDSMYLQLVTCSLSCVEAGSFLCLFLCLGSRSSLPPYHMTTGPRHVTRHHFSHSQALLAQLTNLEAEHDRVCCFGTCLWMSEVGNKVVGKRKSLVLGKDCGFRLLEGRATKAMKDYGRPWKVIEGYGLKVV